MVSRLTYYKAYLKLLISQKIQLFSIEKNFLDGVYYESYILGKNCLNTEKYLCQDLKCFIIHHQTTTVHSYHQSCLLAHICHYTARFLVVLPLLRYLILGLINVLIAVKCMLHAIIVIKGGGMHRRRRSLPCRISLMEEGKVVSRTGSSFPYNLPSGQIYLQNCHFPTSIVNCLHGTLR